MTHNEAPKYSGPSDPARKPLSSRQTDEFYNAALQMPSRRRELTGRVLLDYGLRADELAHITNSWVKKERHPRDRNLAWCIEVPRGEYCTGGNSKAKQQNNDGADLHNTNDPCTKCVHRSYDDKDWVDDEFHQNTPFHPKTAASFEYTVWAIPKESAEETAKLLDGFLKPDRQWPVTYNMVLRDVKKIAKKANELAKEDHDLHGINRDVHPHALRHTFGCRLAAAGYEPTVRMRQLRHNNYAMALYYSRAWGLRHRDSVRKGEWDAVEDF